MKHLFRYFFKIDHRFWCGSFEKNEKLDVKGASCLRQRRFGDAGIVWPVGNAPVRSRSWPEGDPTTWSGIPASRRSPASAG